LGKKTPKMHFFLYFDFLEKSQRRYKTVNGNVIEKIFFKNVTETKKYKKKYFDQIHKKMQNDVS
jgi:hypothetical protein